MKITMEWDSAGLQRKYAGAHRVFLGLDRTVTQRIAPYAKERAVFFSPKKTGRFSNSWHYTTRGTADGSALYLYNQDPKASFVLFGTRAHVIEAGGDAVVFTRNSGTEFYKRVLHPGTKPNDIFEKVGNDRSISSRIQEIADDALRVLSSQL